MKLFLRTLTIAMMLIHTTAFASPAGMLYINDALVVAKPVQASNGIIYVIDTVLLP